MDSLFFWLSKLVWLFVSPDSLLIILFAFGLVLMIRKKQRWAKNIYVLTFTLMVFIGLFPVGEWILYPLEKQYPPNPMLEKVDGIILLGGAENSILSDYWKQPVLGGSAERDFAFIELARKHPKAKMIYTGGNGSMLNQKTKEADVAKQLFSLQGLNTSKIMFEGESRNTWENAVFSKKLSKPEEGENWVLITSARHMPRSAGIFCKVGWKVTPYPVDFNSRANDLFRIDWNFSGHLSALKTGIKEWVGIAAYKFTGKMCSTST